jgi:hypothetical protein
MNPNESVQMRMMLVDALRGHQAHLDFDSATKDFPIEARGWKSAGSPHTAWQLLEHMRIAQWDILEFSRNPKHQSPDWPEGYWPKTEAPSSSKAWDDSVKAFQRDASEFNNLVQDLQNKLLESFEHGDGQTLLREALLLICHNSYHLGQLVWLKKSYDAA